MNGPEHYRRAEEYLVQAWDAAAEKGLQVASQYIACAQVHATLAAAAATAGVLMREWVEGEDDAIAWVKATAT